MKFEEQSFLVTGAARADGIGLSFVKELLDIGVEKIAVFDIVDPSETINKLQIEFSDRTILFHKVNVCNRNEIEQAFKEVVTTFGYVDVLVNVAGICDDARIEDTLHINLFGVIYSTLIATDHMSVKKGGHGGMIVNVASVAGLDPSYQCPVYSASKTGVVAFTRSLADQALAPEFGIKFVSICPALTKTRLLQDALSQLFEIGEYGEEFNQLTAQYGSQTAEECAKSLVQALKKSENGSTWILDKAKYIAVSFSQHYKPE